MLLPTDGIVLEPTIILTCRQIPFHILATGSLYALHQNRHELFKKYLKRRLLYTQRVRKEHSEFIDLFAIYSRKRSYH